MKRHLQCVTSDEATDNKGTQHEKPCSDCPWARKALNGWLGPYSIEEWLAIAHYGNIRVDCHTIKETECAGFAIYQANNATLPRDKTLLVLEPDAEAVFASSSEFRAHHKTAPQPKRKTMASKKAKKTEEKPLKDPPFNPATTALNEIEEAIGEIEGDTKGVSRAKYREFLEEILSMVQLRLETLEGDDDEG